jgi:hypothetical protein
MQDKNTGFVVIVSGLPRSGTSLMMQMLAAGGMAVLIDGNRPADVDNPDGYWEFEPVKSTRGSSAWLHQAQGKAVKMVHLLLMDLPREGYSYRVLLMKRRMAEVLASQRVMLQRQGKPCAPLSDEQLSQIFLGQLQRVEQWLKEQPHFAVLPVSYNELIVDPAPQAAAINEFLGRALDPAKMVCAVNSRLYRQRS